MLKTILNKLLLITKENQSLIEKIYCANSGLASKILNENATYVNQYRAKVRQPMLTADIIGVSARSSIRTSSASKIYANELLELFEKNNLDASFIEAERENICEGNLDEFYLLALQYAGDKIYEDRQIVLLSNLNYNGLVKKIYDVLHGINDAITIYDAVTLTIPDKQLQWEDTPNDRYVHYLNSYKDTINKTDNVFKTLQEISTNCTALEMYLSADRIRKSVAQIYTYQYHLCFEKVFRKIISNADDAIIYETLHNLLFQICSQCSFNDNFRDKVNEALNYLDRQQERSFIRNYGYDMLIEGMVIFFYKLSCFVILSEINTIKPNFSLIPLNINEYEEIDVLVEDIKECIDKNEKMKKYRRLYRKLKSRRNDSEYVNIVCNECYKDFFSLVNDVNVQDNIIFVEDPEQEDSLRVEITNLYYLIYSNVKYKLYRGYKKIESNAEIMRNSLIDREIVVDYLREGIDKEKVFPYLKASNEFGGFVLRLANENDIDNIIKLNNPPVPYRRAIYVKSDDNEIRAAVEAKSVWIIEERVGDTRNIACVAIIINSKMTGFNSTELNKKYEVKFYGKENSDANYLDFDSVLVNDGRSGVDIQSYRGYGFQRLCLVLAEELAKSKGCDYICATVSSFNGPSKRNFVLNGYCVEDRAVYHLREGSSQFYKYIKNEDTPYEERIENVAKIEREIEIYGTILDDLGIDRDQYREDKDVPRDFVVLKLK